MHKSAKLLNLVWCNTCKKYCQTEKYPYNKVSYVCETESKHIYSNDHMIKCHKCNRPYNHLNYNNICFSCQN